jgi:hypothetical protein
MADKDRTLTSQETEARAAIGRHVVYWALTAVTILGITALVMIRYVDEKQFGQVKDVLAILLPMIAAWVGTVLAFYFSKENYIAAAEYNKEVLSMTQQRLQSIPVESAMIPIGSAENKFVLKAPVAQVKLKADLLANTADKTGKNRIVILDDAGIVKYISHRSMLDKFISEKAFGGDAVADLTFANVLGNPEYESWIISYGTLRPGATLSAAKELMDANPKCSDVIVTEDGSRTTRALGWITNVIVSERAKI